MLEQRRALQRLAHDDALGEGDARLRAELRVAALDQGAERRRRQPRGDRAGAAGRELAAIALQRRALAIVVRRHVDDERGHDRVVDEVIADPVGAPRILIGFVAAQPARERGHSQDFAGPHVIRMAILPVRDGDRPRPVTPDGVDGRTHQRRRRRDIAVRPAEVFPDRRAEDRRGRGGFRLALGDGAVARELAGREVDEADRVAVRRVPGDGGAEADFDVVGMRPEDEEVDWHVLDFTANLSFSPPRPFTMLTIDDLRAFAVTRSLFAPTTLDKAIRRLGFVQADPIRAPARAQDLILRHRVRNYRAGDLERRYAALDVEEDVFVNYGFLPREVWAAMHPRKSPSRWLRA